MLKNMIGKKREIIIISLTLIILIQLNVTAYDFCLWDCDEWHDYCDYYPAECAGYICIDPDQDGCGWFCGGCGSDCASHNPDIHPGAQEETISQCSDDLDNDCDGWVDCCDIECNDLSPLCDGVVLEDNECVYAPGCVAEFDDSLPYFEIKGLGGETIAKIDQSGTMWIKGRIDYINPIIIGTKNFIVKDSNGVVQLRISRNSGDLVLKGVGTLHEDAGQSFLNEETQGSVIIKNSNGDNIVRISNDGHLYLKSCVIQEELKCTEGAVETQDCGVTNVGECILGTQDRTCTSHEYWGNWEECEGQINPEDEICGDGLDNDCDGEVDEADCTEGTEVCDNGLDDDYDGYPDCLDSDCNGDNFCDVDNADIIVYVPFVGGPIGYYGDGRTQGNFEDGYASGREGADAFCEENINSNLEVLYSQGHVWNIHALLSVSYTDTARMMPSNYGYNPSETIYWWNPNSGMVRTMANNWNSLFDVNLLHTQRTGTGSYCHCWTGMTANGGYDDGVIDDYACVSWSSSSGDRRGWSGRDNAVNIEWKRFAPNPPYLPSPCSSYYCLKCVASIIPN